MPPMRGPLDDAAEADRAGLHGFEGIRDVVLLQLAGAPAGDIEDLVVEIGRASCRERVL